MRPAPIQPMVYCFISVTILAPVPALRAICEPQGLFANRGKVGHDCDRIALALPQDTFHEFSHFHARQTGQTSTRPASARRVGSTGRRHRVRRIVRAARRRSGLGHRPALGGGRGSGHRLAAGLPSAPGTQQPGVSYLGGGGRCATGDGAGGRNRHCPHGRGRLPEGRPGAAAGGDPRRYGCAAGHRGHGTAVCLYRNHRVPGPASGRDARLRARHARRHAAWGGQQPGGP